MKIFTQFSGTIAVPAVLAALTGKWLDTKYGTTPTFIIILLILAFLSTAVLIAKKAKEFQAEYKSINK